MGRKKSHASSKGKQHGPTTQGHVSAARRNELNTLCEKLFHCEYRFHLSTRNSVTAKEDTSHILHAPFYSLMKRMKDSSMLILINEENRIFARNGEEME